MLLSNRFQKLGHQDERCHHLRVPAIAVMVIACLSVTVTSQSEMEGDCNDNNNNRSTGPHQLYRGGGWAPGGGWCTIKRIGHVRDNVGDYCYI